MRCGISWMKVIPCTDSAVQGNDFELIPTIRIERGHSVDDSTSRDFSSIYIIRELSPDEVGSRSRGSGFLGKTTPCGKILKTSLRKDSPPRRSTSCVQISWNLAYRKSVKSCVIYMTKKAKNRQALALSLLRGSRPKSVRASSRQYTRSAPNFIQIRSLPAEL